MNTECHLVDAQAISSAIMQRAAQVLRDGGLVAFPTETVYGLGGNALDDAAISRIFAAKGRPATNPIIVHVADVSAAQSLVRDFPPSARRLAQRFWPGSLTLVLPKSQCIPDLVTAGGPTVAIRVPAHPVAQALLRACGFPLAAPSANPSTMLSPTTAEHVRRGLRGKIDVILDGGPTSGGIESTVLDVTVTPPRLLRPGLLGVAELEAVVGPIQQGPVVANGTAPARSPGLQARHYAPATPLEVVADSLGRVNELVRMGARIGLVCWRDGVAPPGVVVERLPSEPAAYAAQLYAALHRLDAAGVDRIVVEQPPPGDAWLAVQDRLRRASV